MRQIFALSLYTCEQITMVPEFGRDSSVVQTLIESVKNANSSPAVTELQSAYILDLRISKCECYRGYYI